jgi:hypothetical protein
LKFSFFPNGVDVSDFTSCNDSIGIHPERYGALLVAFSKAPQLS